tara:strand:- start:443 stop:985 length:543 start_codon:yes stop_codon:yes gene_type:complete
MNETYLNKLSKEIHLDVVAAGWWPEGKSCIYEKLQLVSTEVAEATAGARKDLMDDHLTLYKMELVELVDTLIRTLDLGGRLELTYKELDMEHPFIGKDKFIGCNHLGINCCIIDLSKAFYLNKSVDVLNDFYSALIWSILEVAKVRGFNLALPLREKLDYNKIRLDHKLSKRAEKGGKKF